MKISKALHLVADSLLPLVLTLIVTICLFIFTTLNTWEVLEISFVILLFAYIIFLCFLHKIVNKENRTGKVDFITDFLLIISVIFALFTTSIFWTEKKPLRLSYGAIEVKAATEYYENLQQEYYSMTYQYQVPTTDIKLHNLLNREIGLDGITIKYVNMDSKINGFVRIFDKKTIYVNNEPNETAENAFIITHELTHVKGSVNEAETNFKTVKALLDTDNSFLQWVGAQFAVHSLKNIGDNYYNCSELLIRHYQETILQKG